MLCNNSKRQNLYMPNIRNVVFGAQRGTLGCLILSATPALFSSQLDPYFSKKSFMPGLLLISPDSSRNGALCWSIEILRKIT